LWLRSTRTKPMASGSTEDEEWMFVGPIHQVQRNLLIKLSRSPPQDIKNSPRSVTKPQKIWSFVHKSWSFLHRHFRVRRPISVMFRSRNRYAGVIGWWLSLSITCCMGFVEFSFSTTSILRFTNLKWESTPHKFHRFCCQNDNVKNNNDANNGN
jgi:hypothetical protein